MQFAGNQPVGLRGDLRSSKMLHATLAGSKDAPDEVTLERVVVVDKVMLGSIDLAEDSGIRRLMHFAKTIYLAERTLGSQKIMSLRYEMSHTDYEGATHRRPRRDR